MGSQEPENLQALNWKAVAARSEHVAPKSIAA